MLATLGIGNLHCSQLNRFALQPGIERWKKRYTTSTQHQYVKLLRAFLDWIERHAHGQAGLRQSIRAIHEPLPRTIFATDDERERLLQMAKPGLRFFILLCADMGLRHATALRITPAHYSPRDKSIFFTTKNGVQQNLPVTPEIAQTFEFLPPDADPSTPVVAILNRRPIPNSGYHYFQWTQLKAAARVRPELRVHDLRRSAAEAAWEATKDLRAVQALLGHASIVTTNRYLHNRTNPEQIRTTINAMHQARQRHAQQHHRQDTTEKERTQ